MQRHITLRFWMILLILLVAACRRDEGPAGTLVPTTIGGETAVPTNPDEAPAVQPTVDEIDEVDETTDSTELSAQPSGQPAADERPTIRFAVYDWEFGRYEDAIEAFESIYPNIAVELVSINEALGLDANGGGDWPEDAEQRLATAADVINFPFSLQAVRQGLALDLTPFLERDPAMSVEDFYPNSLAAFQWDGGLWSLPLDLELELIYFNKNAFDAAGLAYPQPGWTWDDFLNMAQALTLREGTDVVQWGYTDPYPSAVSLVQAKAGPLFEVEGVPPAVRLQDPQVVAAVQWYADLFLEHEVAPIQQPPDEDGLTSPEGYLLIEQGKAAMWREYSSSWAFRRQDSNMEVGVVPYPIDPSNENSTSITGFRTLSLSAGTQQPEAAWQWASFLSQQPDMAGFGIDMGEPTSLPARRSVAEASDFWEEASEELIPSLQYALDHTYATIFVPWGFAQFNSAIEAILYDGVEVEVALGEAQAAAETARDDQLSELAEAGPVEVVVAAPAGETVDPNATTITFSTPGGGMGDIQRYRDLANQFSGNHPQIIVEVTQPNTFAGAVSLSTVASEADCFQWFPGFDDPSDLAAILSVEPFLDNDATISKDDFYPAAVAAFTHQGQLWGLPGEMAVSVIAYNQDVFDAAGVPYPAMDWTTDDFLESAVALTTGADESKIYGFVPSLLESEDLFTFSERLGAQLIDDSADPPTVSFDHPATVEAVRWFANLTTEFTVKPTLITNITDSTTGLVDIEERQALLDSGRAAMWSAGTNDTMFAATSGEPSAVVDAQRIGVVPFPAGPNGNRSGGVQSASGYFISAQTAARQACWEWIRFLAQQPGTMGLPAHIPTAQSAVYREQVGEEWAAAYIETIRSVTEPPFQQRLASDASWLGFSIIWFTNAYDRILNEDIGVEDALAEAQETADAYRTCIITANGLTDGSAQSVCLRQVDSSLPDSFFAGVADEP